MSFKCDVCHQPQTPRTKPNKVVVVVREVLYQVSKATKKRLGVARTKGYETVKEANICDQCFLPSFTPVVIASDKVVK